MQLSSSTSTQATSQPHIHALWNILPGGGLQKAKYPTIAPRTLTLRTFLPPPLKIMHTMPKGDSIPVYQHDTQGTHSRPPNSKFPRDKTPPTTATPTQFMGKITRINQNYSLPLQQYRAVNFTTQPHSNPDLVERQPLKLTQNR